MQVGSKWVNNVVLYTLSVDFHSLAMKHVHFSLYTDWSSEGGYFVMLSLNPCPENFSQNVVDWGNLLWWGKY